MHATYTKKNKRPTPDMRTGGGFEGRVRPGLYLKGDWNDRSRGLLDERRASRRGGTGGEEKRCSIKADCLP